MFFDGILMFSFILVFTILIIFENVTLAFFWMTKLTKCLSVHVLEIDEI